MKRISPLAFTLALGILLAACSTHPSVKPEGWTPSRDGGLPGSGCPKIFGEFVDRLVSAPANPEEDTGWIGFITMSLALLGVAYEQFPDQTILQQGEDGSTLTVTVSRGGQVLTSRTFSAAKNEFSCADGKLSLTVRDVAYVTLAIQRFAWTVSLEPMDSGGLLLHRQVHMQGLAMPLIPYSSNSEYWYRAEPLGGPSKP